MSIYQYTSVNRFPTGIVDNVTRSDGTQISPGTAEWADVELWAQENAVSLAPTSPYVPTTDDKTEKLDVRLALVVAAHNEAIYYRAINQPIPQWAQNVIADAHQKIVAARS